MSKELNNYKTSLCWHFTNKGHCSLFDKCYFAHGQQELRQKADPLPPSMPPPVTPVSIYKTQLCKVRPSLPSTTWKVTAEIKIVANLRTVLEIFMQWWSPLTLPSHQIMVKQVNFYSQYSKIWSKYFQIRWEREY